MNFRLQYKANIGEADSPVAAVLFALPQAGKTVPCGYCCGT